MTYMHLYASLQRKFLKIFRIETCWIFTEMKIVFLTNIEILITVCAQYSLSANATLFEIIKQE
jgi:hypothetical protein